VDVAEVDCVSTRTHQKLKSMHSGPHGPLQCSRHILSASLSVSNPHIFSDISYNILNFNRRARPFKTNYIIHGAGTVFQTGNKTTFFHQKHRHYLVQLFLRRLVSDNFLQLLVIISVPRK